MHVRIEGKDHDVAASGTCGNALAAALSGKRYKAALAAKAVVPAGDGKTATTLLDLSAPIPADCTELVPVYPDDPDALPLLRHSAAHVMAAAVVRLFPDAKVAIGPAIDTGFYYDFDVARPFSPEDFEAIEKVMAEIVARKDPFVREDIPKALAIERFRQAGEPYKEELAETVPDDTVSLYTCGDFTDLCRGPHVSHTGQIGAVKLMSVAGAYWRGDEHKPMLSRIYATAFPDGKGLSAHLHRIEEAKRRDHRKLGRDLKLFLFQEDVAPGMVIWLPKGMLLRTILEDFWRREHLKRGYDMVQGPQLLRVETWKNSGHYDHYRENMYFTSIEEDEYGIKPMNCISHMLIFRSDTRSYRDLPQRYFELGVVHRHEKSGVLHGLLRVRQFTQDDAHILCTPDQMEGEILDVIRLIQDLMGLFGFQYKIAVSTRPESSIGTDEAWETSTAALISAVEKAGLPYEINEGDGAFYGPKIDVRLLDCIGREWQCSTIQVDFTLPERFDLTYVDSDGERKRPVMVHRAIMGSLERFIGVLVEQYAGALPTWIAPEQVRLLTVVDDAAPFAQEALRMLQDRGIRAHADIRNEKLGFKVREAQLDKVPYMFVVGEREVQDRGVNIRLRSGESLGFRTVAEAAALVLDDAQEPFRQGGMCYSFA
ncbi:MAG: threonine--tRNA ligase [Desulfovibrio sp.]|jgi:threonyl-tRNA synthetase|nr:threonine--tRNA ligase [Desulfovibrio sp.]